MYLSEKKFHSIYKKEKSKIDLILKKSLQGRKPSSLYEPGSYILHSEGKRLRPLLVLLSAKAVGGKFNQVYNAAAAVEMLHNFTLVHDDIMDNADKRRGRLTLHKKYDNNTAILVGDSLLSVAYEYLLMDCSANAKEVMGAFTQGLVDVCEGQSMDTDFEMKKRVTIKEYLVMITKKTAAMAEMCCRIGATLGGGSKIQVNSLSNYGKNLGIAFQIQDDLLDISADEKEFGKTIGGDLVEGKKTYLFIKALEKATGEDRKSLSRVISSYGVRKNQVKKYKLLYEKLGVLDESKKEIRKYTNRALNALKIFNSTEQKILYMLADALIERTK
ncbi:MAG: polyprenyl synthetase family protein [Ignavibacteria bacterium]|nr:polyprenyl synthetase family protein [Ignavibacteria bacterium]MBT8382669.1 polyprenyl synthetase family protein [Ignavibacteria bacterium]MBT8391748.1 polyprenyl synthetase family protein [Ignavibacteria bacterium]NNJ51578.1 polyprenyl synthetase family protein [Ignavibacteriaceae bacterium]NNL20316.1 polyprenyl synthetase family protein [Ignavibacteriaceae bacterium]